MEIDPELAQAWDGLGAVYLRGILSGERTTDEGRPLAIEALGKALEADPTLASAHYHIGFMRMLFDWNFAGAEASYLRALEFEPNSAPVLSGLGLLSMMLGRPREALDFQRRSLEIDPLRSASHHNLGFVAFHAREYELAEESFRSALEMAENYSRGHYYIAVVLLSQGRFEEAHALAQEETGELYRLAAIALTNHALGHEDESEAAINELAEKYSDKAAYLIAEAHAYRGEIDQAFRWLERAVEQHEPLVPWMRSSPLLDGLHSDPRFDRIVQELGVES